MNYKELCELLGEEENVRHKAYHLKKLRKEFDIVEVDKNDYEVNGQLSTVEKLEAMDTMKKNRAYIEPLLYSYIYNQPSHLLVARMSQLLQQLSLVNEDFYTIKHNTDIAYNIIAEREQRDIGDLQGFINSSEPILKRIVYDVLRDMRLKCLIDIQYMPTIFSRVQANNGEFIYVSNILSEREMPKFLDAERTALDRLGYDSLKDVKFHDFKSIKSIIAQELNCATFCYTYKIIINKNGIEKYLVDDIEGVRASFNNYIQTKLKAKKNKALTKFYDLDMDLYLDYCISIEKCKNIRDIIRDAKRDKSLELE